MHLPNIKTQLLNHIRSVGKTSWMERLLVRLTQNRTAGSFFTRLPPNHYQYAPGSIRKVRRNGINFILDISDLVDWYIYFGFKEPAREELYHLINPGDMVIDVGANVGEVALHAAKLTSSSGMVYAFEPDPVNYARLQQNKGINSLRNIATEQIGLGSKTDKLLLQTVNAGNKGMNRIDPAGKRSTDNREVQVITLDSYVRHHSIKKVNLIKVDVEGFELQVLKGCSETLDKHQPYLFIELDDEYLRIQGDTAAELVKFLADRGYILYRAATGMPVTPQTGFFNCHYDVVAYYKGSK